MLAVKKKTSWKCKLSVAGVDANIPVSSGARPQHVAIIMDGNNRWAKKNSLVGISGHKAGVDAVRAAVETCVREGGKPHTFAVVKTGDVLWMRCGA